MLKIIKNEQEYADALKQAEALVSLDPAPGTLQDDESELLTLSIEEYEEELYPIDIPDPIDAIKFRMDKES